MAGKEEIMKLTAFLIAALLLLAGLSLRSAIIANERLRAIEAEYSELALDYAACEASRQTAQPLALKGTDSGLKSIKSRR